MSPYRLSAGRVLVVVLFALSCFTILLYLWSVFGGPVPMRPAGYRVTMAIPEAEILTDNADVRVSGVSVGRVVTTAKVGKDPNRKDVLIEVDSKYAPIGNDVKAIIRRKSIGGEMYVEITPGTKEAPRVPDGGRLPHANVAESVELDEVFQALDPKTRTALQDWFHYQSLSVEGNGQALSDALGNLAGFEQSSTEFLKLLNGQTGAVREAVKGTGDVFAALSQRRDALQGVITNGEKATRVLAERDEEFADVWRALPAFEAESRRLLARADSFAENADPVVRQLRPAWRALAPLARDAEPFAADLEGLARGADAAERASVKGLPAATRTLTEIRPLVKEFSPFLQQLVPVVGFLGDHQLTLSGFFGTVTALTQATSPGITDDTPIHYARTMVNLGPEMLASPGATRWPTNRANPYTAPGVAITKDRPIPVFDDRHCGPDVFPDIVGGGRIDDDLLRKIKTYALKNGEAKAPPCVLAARPAGRYTSLEPLPKDR